MDTRKYEPTIDTLQYVLDRRYEEHGNVDTYKYLIGIRHHASEEMVIDHILNCILANHDIDIFISISLSCELHENISEELNEVIDNCNYIRIILPHDMYRDVSNNHISTTSHIYQNNNDVNYEYFIFHTSSERYIGKFESVNIIYEKLEINEREKIIDNNELMNKCHETWKGWGWKNSFIKNNKLLDFYIKYDMLPALGQGSGTIIPKWVVDDFINEIFINFIDEKQYIINGAEILIPSYLRSYYKDCTYNSKYIKVYGNICSITNCFWNSYGKNDHNLKTIINDINKDKLTYICAKRCDSKNNPIRKYAQENFMTTILNII